MNIKYLFSILAILAVISTSCNKEQLDDKKKLNDSKAATNSGFFSDGTEYGFYVDLEPNVPFGKISIGDYGMLEFESMEAFKQTINELERMGEKWQKEYYNKFTDLPTDSMIIMEDTTGYSDEQIFIDFEDALGFSSLRAKIAEEEIQYRKIKNPSIENDPNSHFIFEKRIRTVVNQYEEVCIGDSIYKLFEGFEISMPRSLSDTLPLLRGNDSAAYNIAEECESIIFPVSAASGSGSGCDVELREGDRGFKGGNTDDVRIKWVISIWEHVWDSSPRIMVKTKYQEFKDVIFGLGYWHKVNKDVLAKLKEDSKVVTDIDECTKETVGPDLVSQTPGGGKAKLKLPICDECRVESGDVKGYHNGGGI